MMQMIGRFTWKEKCIYCEHKTASHPMIKVEIGLFLSEAFTRGQN